MRPGDRVDVFLDPADPDTARLLGRMAPGVVLSLLTRDARGLATRALVAGLAVRVTVEVLGEPPPV